MKTQVEPPQDLGNARITGILIGTYQTAGNSEIAGQNVEDEGNGQLYMLGGLSLGPGILHLEVRGGTSPRHDGVTSFYGEVNDSVGETLNGDGDGRIAATQLYYELPVGEDELSAGLIDATAILDANPIADNEYEQFLGTSFVNNPSIEYPSFALGTYYHGSLSERLDYQVLVSSSGGLEDANDPTYANVFDVGDDDKGVFTATELLWQAGGFGGDVGLWYNSGDHTDLNDPNTNGKDNYGAYTSINGPLAGGQWVGWAGIANDTVAAAANFLALAYRHGIGDTTLGVGIARIGASNALPGNTDDILQAELYWRIHVAGGFYITPDLQYVANSGFDPQRDSVIAGLRAGIEF